MTIRNHRGWAVILLLLGTFVGSGCEQTPEVDMQPGETGFPPDRASDTTRIGALWVRSCGLCHVDGNAGAPIVGDEGVWAERVAKGREVLMTSTLDGLGNMPPLGYCMACTREDFEALIDMTIGNAPDGAGDA